MASISDHAEFQSMTSVPDNAFYHQTKTLNHFAPSKGTYLND